MDFSRTRALVTGASSGIGEAFARELARRGADLVLVARSEDKLARLAAELSHGAGGARVAAEVLPADLSAPGAAARLAARLQERGLETDVLVNCAGFGLFGALPDADAGRLTEEIQVNVVALTELTRALLPGMLARDRGAIVNVASTAAFQPVPYMSVYGASKAYVLSFTEALWAETRRTGVRVTALCPGATDTAFFDSASDNASLGRRMSPEAVVRSALRALDRRRGVVIPGTGNRMLAAAPRLAPRGMTSLMAERTMRPKGEPGSAGAER
jgi:short-subunit dehydrogenase